jgi:hypothetical protein
MTSPVSAVEAIEKAMELATPGDWHDAPGTTTGRVVLALKTTKAKRRVAALGGPDRDGNAAYIVACSPDRMREVLALASQAEALKRENAQKGSLQKVVNAVLTWAELRCPCHNDQPNPCPLCGASVENLEPCKSAENTLPRHLLTVLRRARTLLKEEANAE